MFKIVKASAEDAETVLRITHYTIKEIYPHYYPAGAVDFFLNHHSLENIIRDIADGNVWLLNTDTGDEAGTVTINRNEINRLFVLPEYQGKGYGRGLIDFAEEKISHDHSEAELSASLPAKQIYIKRGYITTGYFIIDTDNGDKLCYDYMTKLLH